MMNLFYKILMCTAQGQAVRRSHWQCNDEGIKKVCGTDATHLRGDSAPGARCREGYLRFLSTLWMWAIDLSNGPLRSSFSVHMAAANRPDSS